MKHYENTVNINTHTIKTRVHILPKHEYVFYQNTSARITKTRVNILPEHEYTYY